MELSRRITHFMYLSILLSLWEGGVLKSRLNIQTRQIKTVGMNMKLSEHLPSMKLNCYSFDLHRERMGKCRTLLLITNSKGSNTYTHPRKKSA